MPAPRPGGGDSFITYMIGQRAKAGQGLAALDNALGAGAPSRPQQTTVGAPGGNAGAATPPDAPATPAPTEEPLFNNAPNLIRPQPRLHMNPQLDTLYRMLDRAPTAAETAVVSFERSFRASTGRAPTRGEVLGQLFRRPDYVRQETQDFEVAE